MPTNKYWQNRFVMMQDAQLKKGESYLVDLDDQFLKASMKIEGQIATWYQRFAINNKISLTEAKVMLSGKALKEFNWDVKEYIKMGKQNALDQSWMQELENASARVHISRLESLKMQMQQQVEVLYGNHLDDADSLMKKMYEDGYYHTAFEIQKGFNVGYDLHKLNSDQLEKIIAKPWTTDNRTFSDRIWGSKQELINQVHTGLTQGIIRGDAPGETIKTIAAKFGVKKNQAGRLIMTESAFFASASSRDCFKDLDVEKYEVVATLDSHTSTICQGLDGKVFKMDDFEVGSTAPPFHVWCRSVTVPYFDDNIGERAARGDNGKTYNVPSDMKYEDWHKTFVDPTSTKGDIIKNIPIVPVKTFSEKIQTIRDAIAANGGVITESHLQSAGKIIQTDLSANRMDIVREIDSIQVQIDDLGMDKIQSERIKIMGIRRGLFDPSELGLLNDDQLSDNLNELNFKLLKKESEIKPKFDELKLKQDLSRKKYIGKGEENAKELKDKLSEIRKVGNGSHDVDVHLNKSRSPMRAVVKNAHDYYPTDWVEASIKDGTLTPKKVDRGYYNHYGSEIAISGGSDNKMLATALHELGHRFERTTKGVLSAEKLFYERRTLGESLQWLGGNYSYSEKSRFDKFLDTYMGKDYAGSAYELVSMGFQDAYMNPTKLWKDEDYATWIYGILALL